MKSDPVFTKGLLLGALLFLSSPLVAHEGHDPAETDFQGDRCAECNMVVNNKSYAAQIVGSDKPLFFDDIGCLVQHERQGKIQPEAVHARFVRTAIGTSWIAVEKAVWVMTKDVRTPMGYGLHAFADKAAAEAFVQGKAAQRLTWNDLPGAIPAKVGMGMPKGKM